MDRVPLSEAEGHMAEVIGRVEKGEEIVIVRNGIPAARLVPVVDAGVSEAAATARRPIRFGLAKGRIKIADDFDAPLPDDLLKSFYGVAPDEEWPESWKDVPG